VVVDAEVNETNKTTHRSERGSVLARKNKGDKKLKKTEKKDLTGPTLLEMSLTVKTRRFPLSQIRSCPEKLDHIPWRFKSACSHHS